MRDLGPLFDSFPLGMEAYDTDGNLVAINEAAKAHFGIEGDVSGVNLLEDSTVRPEIKEAFASRSLLDTRTMLDPATCGFPTTRTEAVWSRIRGFPGTDGQKDLYFVLFEDISTRTAAREAFGGEKARSVLRLTNVDTPVLGLDRNLRIVLCNKAWAAWHGMGRHIAEGLSVHEVDKRFANNEAAHAVQNALLHAKTTTLTSTREERTYEIDIYPATWGAFLRWRDVTKWLQAQERLTRLAHSLNNHREEESQRLARELHDEVGGNLVALSFALQALKRLDAPPAISEALGRAQAMADETLATVRNLARHLHPAMLVELGLPNALATLAKHSSATAGVPVEVSVPKGWKRFDPARALCVYRFVQEALTNIARHAKGTTAACIAGKDENGRVLVTVTDDGAGFDPLHAPRGLGLRGMEERAALFGGSVAISSQPDHGTKITLSLPPGEASA